MLHVIGLLPIVRSRAFDMVSDGKSFKLSIPPLNKFIEGPAEDSPQPSTNTLENLRPHVFFDSLLLHEIGPDEVAVLEQGTDVVQDTNNKKKSWELPDYIVNVIVHDADRWRLQRKITFSRIDLKPHRQMIYDRSGAVATEAVYDNFADFQGVNFPSQIPGSTGDGDAHETMLQIPRRRGRFNQSANGITACRLRIVVRKIVDQLFDANSVPRR